jgi:hypothetical protein
MVLNAWAPPAPGAKYGMGTAAASSMSELTAVPTPSKEANESAQPWNPANPLFWFAAIAAVTFGLMAVSTTVRVGPAKGSVSLGKTS